MDSEITIIDAKSSKVVNLSEIWKYRLLLLTLAWRDIKVKYAQTYIGILWAFFTPITSMLVLYFVFNKIAKVSTENVHPLVFTMSGLVAWNYFSVLITDAGNSLLNAQNMIKKIYFPKIILPLSKSISGLLDLAISLICLIVLSIIYDSNISENIVYLPFIILLIILCGVTGGLWMSSLTIRYRDLRFVIPVLTRLGMFITPVAFSSQSVPQEYKSIFYCNPLAGTIELFRWSIYGTEIDIFYIYLSITILAFLFIGGLFMFSRIEANIADII